MIGLGCVDRILRFFKEDKRKRINALKMVMVMVDTIDGECQQKTLVL
jgi:hypothetical protein